MDECAAAMVLMKLSCSPRSPVMHDGKCCSRCSYVTPLWLPLWLAFFIFVPALLVYLLFSTLRFLLPCCHVFNGLLLLVIYLRNFPKLFWRLQSRCIFPASPPVSLGPLRAWLCACVSEHDLECVFPPFPILLSPSCT